MPFPTKKVQGEKHQPIENCETQQTPVSETALAENCHVPPKAMPQDRPHIPNANAMK